MQQPQHARNGHMTDEVRFVPTTLTLLFEIQVLRLDRHRLTLLAVMTEHRPQRCLFQFCKRWSDQTPAVVQPNAFDVALTPVLP